MLIDIVRRVCLIVGKGAGFHFLDSHLEFTLATALRNWIDDTDFVATFSSSLDLIR
ncbi:hypothetical protein [Streptococcus sp. LYSM12]|uniref:hypothetical protein n=1 Tax=unclassified Streptococcus TaxID=2608887 RepID=UPI0014306B30|nr:hypothetical protein [Streptococcus sp. LYSM12]MCQ9213264.1 hypothetical protein [Streptococcus sp. O1]